MATGDDPLTTEVANLLNPWDPEHPKLVKIVTETSFVQYSADPWGVTPPRHNEPVEPVRPSPTHLFVENHQASSHRDSQRDANRESQRDAQREPRQESPRRQGPLSQAKSAGELKSILAGDWDAPKDIIEVQVCSEKTGFMAMFKHTNYELLSSLRGISVIRRYSDFVWLQDILLKRYPFRCLPILPPKKVVGADELFIEDRRRGLARFLNFLANHPIFRKDDVLEAFLTYDLDIHTYRNSNSIILEEEFTKLQVTEEMFASVPQNAQDRINGFVRMAPELLGRMDYFVEVMERLATDLQGAAVEYGDHSLVLNKLTEHLDCIFPECIICPRLNHGYNQMSEVFQAVAENMDNHKSRLVNGFAEDLRANKDFLTGLIELHLRADRAVSSLHPNATLTRINSNKNRLVALDQNSHRLEYDRLLKAIDQDQRDFDYQNARCDFVLFCVWSELVYYHSKKSSIGSIYRFYIQDQLDHAKQLADIWAQGFEILDEMPTQGF